MKIVLLNFVYKITIIIQNEDNIENDNEYIGNSITIFKLTSICKLTNLYIIWSITNNTIINSLSKRPKSAGGQRPGRGPPQATALLLLLLTNMYTMRVHIRRCENCTVYGVYNTKEFDMISEHRSLSFTITKLQLKSSLVSLSCTMYSYCVLQGCPYLAGSRPKNLGPKTTKGPKSKRFKFNLFLDTALLYFSLLVIYVIN